MSVVNSISFLPIAVICIKGLSYLSEETKRNNETGMHCGSSTVYEGRAK